MSELTRIHHSASLTASLSWEVINDGSCNRIIGLQYVLAITANFVIDG